LKEEALDRTLWRSHFGRGYGPVVRQTAEWKSFKTCAEFREYYFLKKKTCMHFSKPVATSKSSCINRSLPQLRINFRKSMWCDAV
jgi:hypothetical protein